MSSGWRARMLLVFVAGLVSAPAAALFSAPAAAKSPAFYPDLEPLLRARCTGCHGGDKPKARLRLSTPEELQAGGRRGVPVVPGKPDESLLFLLITGQKKPVMPPEKEGRLSAEEIGLIRAWIEGGCLPGERPQEAAPYARALEAPRYTRLPIVKALAYSSDGARIFIGAYREVLVHRASFQGAEPAGSGEPEARFLGEAEEIQSLQLSPDGRRLLAVGGSAGRFGELQLWDVERGTLERFARIGKDVLFAGSFSPDGQKIVVGGTDRALHVLEVSTGKEILNAEVHSDWVFGAAFTADGARILSAGRDKTVKVIDSGNGEFLGTLATLPAAVLRVAARPSSPEFVVGGESPKPVVFDAQALKQAKELEGQPGAVLALAASTDGSLYAVGGAGDEVRIYDAKGGGRKLAVKVPGGWVYAIAFRPDGKRLAVSGFEGLVRIFDTADGKELRALVPVPAGKYREL